MAVDPNQWERIEPTPPNQLPSTTRGAGTGNPPWAGAKPAPGARGAIAGPPPETQPSWPIDSDVYAWHRVNEALVNAGMGDGNWQIAGASHKPVNTGTYVKNPSYKAAPAGSTPEQIAEWNQSVNAGQQEYSLQESPTWVIGVVNKATGQMFKLTLGRSGNETAGYSYTVLQRDEQGKIDAKNGGYTGVQRIPFTDGHEEFWGTNAQTGAFEKMPTQPAGLGNTSGWNDVRQIDNGQGQLVWVGTNPEGVPLQPIPNAPPPIPTAKYVPGSVRQVTVGGKIVYRGQNPQTGEWEDIPSLGSETAPIQTTTVAGQVYKQNPNAGQPGEPDFVKVSGIASPNNGDKQWVDAGGGMVKRQVYNNGVWSDVGPDDPEGAWRAVDPRTVAAHGAILPKGQKYEVLTNINGNSRLLTVVADGNGGYTIPEDTKSRAVPGAPIEKPVTATSNEQEFITRYNTETQQQETVRNPNWSPAATGDRVRQLRELAAAKQKELSEKINKGGYTEAQAHTDFNSWWDTEIEPRRQSLQFDQEQDRLKAEREAQTARQSALSSASTMGQQAVERYQSMQRRQVSPEFLQQGAALGEAVAKGTKPPAITPSAFVTNDYDLNQLHQYYTAQALQHISPTAAGMLGTQPTMPQAMQGLDLNTLVNRASFQPQGQPQVSITIGGQQQQQPPAAPPAAAPPPPLRPLSPIPDLNNFFGPFRGALTG